MRKIVAGVLLAVLMITILAGCGGGGKPKGMSKNAYEVGKKVVAYYDTLIDDTDSYITAFEASDIVTTSTIIAGSLRDYLKDFDESGIAIDKKIISNVENTQKYFYNLEFASPINSKTILGRRNTLAELLGMEKRDESDKVEEASSYSDARIPIYMSIDVYESSIEIIKVTDQYLDSKMSLKDAHEKTKALCERLREIKSNTDEDISMVMSCEYFLYLYESKPDDYREFLEQRNAIALGFKIKQRQ